MPSTISRLGECTLGADFRGIVEPKRFFEDLRQYGTGFFIAKEGLIVTCCHVVEQSRVVKIFTTDGRNAGASIAAIDKQHDIAILRTESRPTKVCWLSVGDSGVGLGTKVTSIGFPNPQARGFDPKTLPGEINGPVADTEQTELELTMNAEPGYSGGAVISDSGAVVGVISRIQTPLQLARMGKAAAHTVTYATKAKYISQLFRNPGLVLSGSKELSSRDAAVTNLRSATVQVLAYGLNSP